MVWIFFVFSKAVMILTIFPWFRCGCCPGQSEYTYDVAVILTVDIAITIAAVIIMRLMLMVIACQLVGQWTCYDGSAVMWSIVATGLHCYFCGL